MGTTLPFSFLEQCVCCLVCWLSGACVAGDRGGDVPDGRLHSASSLGRSSRTPPRSAGAPRRGGSLRSGARWTRHPAHVLQARKSSLTNDQVVSSPRDLQHVPLPCLRSSCPRSEHNRLSHHKLVFLSPFLTICPFVALTATISYNIFVIFLVPAYCEKLNFKICYH